MPPHHSAGLGQVLIDCFERQGHNVDFLTLYSYVNQPKNVISVFETKNPNIHDNQSILYKRIRGMLKKFARKLGIIDSLRKISKNKNSYISNNGISIKYPDESKPGVASSLILAKIHKKYDAVVTQFWQDMINSTSLREIYNHLGCPIIIASPDMAPMTGGCFYFGDCRNFMTKCGKCAGFNSNEVHDQSRKNYLIKKDNYDSINCVFLGNTWMNIFAEQSKLFKNIEKMEIIIDEKIFVPSCKENIRSLLGIPSSKNFILMLKSDQHPRKGNNDILKSFEYFFDSLSEEQRKGCMVISVGEDYFKRHSRHINCDVFDYGFVDIYTLISLYQASSFFVNASLDDAGPSMVNQSIMCGTPVICYDNGTAIDVITDGKSGFKVQTGHTEELYKALKRAYEMNDDEYTQLCENSRCIAVKHNSIDSVGQRYEAIIKKYSNLQRIKPNYPIA